MFALIIWMILKLNVARSLCSQVSAVPFCISKGNRQHNEDTLFIGMISMKWRANIYIYIKKRCNSSVKLWKPQPDLLATSYDNYCKNIAIVNSNNGYVNEISKSAAITITVPLWLYLKEQDGWVKWQVGKLPCICQSHSCSLFLILALCLLLSIWHSHPAPFLQPGLSHYTDVRHSCDIIIKSFYFNLVFFFREIHKHAYKHYLPRACE